MIRIARPLLPALLAVAAAAQDPASRPEHPPSEETLTGRVVDAAGAPVSAACVVLCDGVTGIPIHAPTKQRFTVWSEDEHDDAHSQLMTAMTDAAGGFSFQGVPEGRYRLVAQSWPGRAMIEDVFEKNGVEVWLRGVAAGVVVPSGAGELTIRPLGDATLVVAQEQEKDSHTLILVSSAPLAADPVLMFAAWSGPFAANLLGANRTADGRVVFRGLPAGEVHLGLFTNDDNPGFGGRTVTLEPGGEETVSIPVIANWSSGVKTPPKRLEPLVAKVAGLDTEQVKGVVDQLGPGVLSGTSLGPERFARIVSVLDREIVLPDGERARAADVLAALGYARLQQQ